MARILTNEIISAAIDGYEAQKSQIDTKIADLRAMLPDGSGRAAAPSVPPKRRRRRISAAGRARIAAAQRKRWAALNGPSGEARPEPSKPKRRLSRAGKAAIVAALKKRWAAKRAEASKAHGRQYQEESREEARCQESGREGPFGKGG